MDPTFREDKEIALLLLVHNGTKVLDPLGWQQVFLCPCSYVGSRGLGALFSFSPVVGV
jgi:hypothetical protein